MGKNPKLIGLRDIKGNADLEKLRVAILEYYVDGGDYHPVNDTKIVEVAERACGGPFPSLVLKAIDMVIGEYIKKGELRWINSIHRPGLVDPSRRLKRE